MMELNKFLCSAFIAAFSCMMGYFFKTFQPETFNPETSVWCYKSASQTNVCKFRNICYNAYLNSFLFFFGKDTVIKGINNYRELQKVQLSSVKGHNQFYANLSVVDNKKYKLTTNIKVYSKILLLSRFKPNNLMHVIHDDLFPVFLTLEFVCSGDIKCMESYTLMFHDNYPEGPFFVLYKLLSNHFPVLPKELRISPNTVICFEEMITGLIVDGIFYQYGFKQPHGPVKPTELTPFDISRFTSFIKNKLGIHKSNTSSEVILLSRQKNRKILNILEVKVMIENVYYTLNKKIKVKLINLDLFKLDIMALIKMVSECEGLIAMHGAEMILSLFMKPGSYVFEIFPFGINPSVVSFIKPISELNGSNFVHFPWRNLLKNNSVAHPNAHLLFGGIAHLDKMTQESIKNANEVPPVECCNNPLFLYHMYQDTWISNEFGEFFFNSLVKISKKQQTNNINQWFYPYKVLNVSCNFDSQNRLLTLDWHPPFNADGDNLKYSLYVKDQKGLFSKDIFTDKTNVQIEIPVNISPVFEIWISSYCNTNGSKGPDLYIRCT